MAEPQRLQRRRLLGSAVGAALGLAMVGPLLSALPRSAAAAEADALTLDRLLEEFRKSPGFSARFAEEKHIALLKAPLKSEGALYFLPKDKLARHVEQPKRSVLLLDGHVLRVADGDGVRRLDLAQSPALAALVQSFAHVLGGDRVALDRNFLVDFKGEQGSAGFQARWQLRLRPRGEPLSRMVTSLEVTGKGKGMTSLVVEEPSGDRSITRFTEVQPQRRFSDEERKRFFALPSQD
jgi:outer membrane lipoprotein-sorting protein